MTSHTHLFQCFPVFLFFCFSCITLLFSICWEKTDEKTHFKHFYFEMKVCCFEFPHLKIYSNFLFIKKSEEKKFKSRESQVLFLLRNCATPFCYFIFEKMKKKNLNWKFTFQLFFLLFIYFFWILFYFFGGIEFE